MSRHLRLCSLAAAFAITTSSHAGVLDVQSNPVANGAIVVSPGDNDRSDWAGLPFYPVDPTGDASPIDWTGLQVAHDDTNLYLHLLMAPQSSPQYFGSNHNLYLDTDQDRDTGFYGGGGFLAAGADFLIQGPSLYAFGGGANQGAFAWNSLSALLRDDFPTNDVEVAVPLAMLGNPQAIDFFLNAVGTPEDYYPNGATGGVAGDYFTYSLVPEPSSALMLALATLAYASARILNN